MNFAASQRARESKVLEFTLQKLGITPIGHVAEAEAATQEGGDFVILTPDTAALGVGLRSNYNAAKYLMKNDLLGFKRFWVVKDVFDMNQDRMHLDCIFSPLHRRLAVLDAEVSQPKSLRYVDEYIRQDSYSEELQSWYKLSRANVEFAQLLKDEGYTLIRLPHECQLAYGCNALHLGCIDNKWTVLNVHPESKKFIEESEEFKQYCAANNCQIELVYVPFRQITSMYGSLHCASQVLERVPFEKDGIVREHDDVRFVEPQKFDYIV